MSSGEEMVSAASMRAVLWRQALVLASLLILGAALRVYWNDVTPYSPADEQVYVGFSKWLDTNGLHEYPALWKSFLDHPGWAAYPSPLRWGYLTATTLTCRLIGRCDARALAWLSTVAGVLSLLLTFMLGRELAGTGVALAAVALSCTSPLQLALGRRALQDEPFCAVSLLALWLAAVLLRQSAARSMVAVGAGAIVSATVALSFKESFVVMAPALLAAAFAARAPAWPRFADIAVSLAPPALFALVSTVPAGGVTPLVRMVRTVLAAFSRVPYAQQYQAGPPHRVLFDLFVLAPIVCLAGVAAVTVLAYRPAQADRTMVWIGVTLGVSLVAFSLLSLKNVRLLVTADPLIRILAAWLFVRHPLVRPRWAVTATVLLIVVNAIAELAIFHRVFVAAAVYDPVTENLLRALGAISH